MATFIDLNCAIVSTSNHSNLTDLARPHGSHQGGVVRRLKLAMSVVLAAPLVAFAVMASPAAKAPAARADALNPAAPAENPNPLHAGR
jgi:hypothetical protein